MPTVNCNDEDCVYCDGTGCQADEITIEKEVVILRGEGVVLSRCMTRETLEG